MRPKEYAGGEEGVEGLVVEVSVIRSVTICVGGMRRCDKRTRRATYALVECLALADEDDVALDEVRVQSLDSRQDNVSGRYE